MEKNVKKFTKTCEALLEQGKEADQKVQSCQARVATSNSRVAAARRQLAAASETDEEGNPVGDVEQARAQLSMAENQLAASQRALSSARGDADRVRQQKNAHVQEIERHNQVERSNLEKLRRLRSGAFGEDSTALTEGMAQRLNEAEDARIALLRSMGIDATPDHVAVGGESSADSGWRGGGFATLDTIGYQNGGFGGISSDGEVAASAGRKMISDREYGEFEARFEKEMTSQLNKLGAMSLMKDSTVANWDSLKDVPFAGQQYVRDSENLSLQKSEPLPFIGNEEIRIMKEFHRRLYESKQLKLVEPVGGEYVSWVNPKDIIGIFSENESIVPEKFWSHHGESKERYYELVLNVSKVTYELNQGMTLEQLKESGRYIPCIEQYFTQDKMIRVYKYGDKYIFDGDGRHRVRIAQEMGINIPIKVYREVVKE